MWADWLAERRHGGDADVRRELLAKLAVRRDKILDRAELEEGETLLDVGCGEGLIGFGALERDAGHVVFSDISDDLLDFCREAAEALGFADRCSFAKAPADDLGVLADATADVVSTRSVLIYVADKERAFREFFRVLKPGGRISLYEPINRFGMEERRQDFWGYPVDGVRDVARRVDDVFDTIQPEEDPMLDFDERDLLRQAEAAGFYPLELEYHAEIRAQDPKPWPAFLHSSGNPKIPTIAEAMDRVLSPEEREQLSAHLRPLVEAGSGVWRIGHAYLVATKPA